jgi:hypothetical protein
VNDLRTIAVAVYQTQLEQAQLPVKLADISRRTEAVEIRIADPITGAPYEYAPKTGSAYELCANFVTSSREQDWPEVSRAWAHPPGRHCFSLDASNPPALGVPIPR